MRFVTLGYLALIASPAFALEESRIQLLVDLVRQNGCELTEADAAKVLAPGNFPKEESQQIAEEVVIRGWADANALMAGRLILTDEICKG